MSEYSKVVMQQMNNAEEIARATDTHIGGLFRKMAELLKPYMTEEEYCIFQEQMGRFFSFQTTYLRDITQNMGIADLEHSRELLQTADAREKRDLAVVEVLKSAYSLKQAISGFHGDSALALLGMAGETPRHPIELKRWLENIINIVDRGVVLPPQTLRGPLVWTPQSILDLVKPLHLQLSEALELVSQEQQEDKETLTRKWQLMELQNYIYSSIAGMAECYARFVGEHDLGERLRPRPITRPKSKKEMEEGENGDSPETPGTDITPPVSVTPVNPPPIG